MHASVSARLPFYGKCSKSDVALFRSTDNVNFVAGEIVYLFSVDSEPIVCANLFSPISFDVTSGVAVWQMAGRHIFLTLESISSSVIWSETSSGRATTLIPVQCSGFRAVDL